MSNSGSSPAPFPASRPAFVVAFMADNQGCGFHRVMMPLGSLVESGVVDGRIDMAVWPDHVGAAAKPDVVVWQRQVEDAQIDAMARWRKMLPDALFIYELDDYLGEIPKASFHASFMPLDIESRVRRGLALCDRATTTTQPMADWLRRISDDDKGMSEADKRSVSLPVFVVPNALPQARLKEREPSPAGRIRVGFAGGMSHSGDLELIREAMTEIGDKVTWVFFGTKPENPPCQIEFHEGLSANVYLDKMAMLDVDVMLAPLEQNTFNECKSNLRLVEATAIGAAVIAQDILPYRTDKPPVFAYAKTPKDWTDAILKFIATRPSDRKHHADALRSWVGRHYTMERQLKNRIEAWLPPAYTWKPATAKDHGASGSTYSGSASFVVACSDAVDTNTRLSFLTKNRKETTGLVDACNRAIALGVGVLWLRPATTMTGVDWTRMQTALDQAPNIATVTALASDGMNAFPSNTQWTPMPPATSMSLSDIVGYEFEGRRLAVVAPSGPVVLMSRHALSMLGAPDVAGCDGNEEAAILEWGLRATARQWKHMQAVDAFVSSIAPPAPPAQTTVLRIQARGFASWLQQGGELLTAVEREDIELQLLSSQWGGPRPGMIGFGNDYESWSALRQIKHERDEQGMAGDGGGYDSENARLATCLPFGETTTTEWAVWYDENVHFTDLALLSRVVRDCSIADINNIVSVIYADHDSDVGGTISPEFKPDFDKELFLALDYITPICAVRLSALDHTPIDRADLYEMILDIALVDGAKAFRHVPRVAGRMKVDSKPEAMALDTLSRQVAIQQRLGDSATVTAHKHIAGCLSVIRSWRNFIPNVYNHAPLVSIVVPTLGSGRLIQPCVATILQHTAYPNYEVLVVQNGERKQPELSEAIIQDPRVRIVYYDPHACGRTNGGFNWSAINNWAIREHAKGAEYIVTMNDDVCTATKGWLDAMMGHAVQDDVGVVGARLLHPMGVIQHVGVICHRGIAGHMHKGIPNGQAGHMGRAMLTHEASAVTGACMLFKRDTFELVGGFDESLTHNYNDTVFCLRVRNMHARSTLSSYRNVVEMSAEMLHPEGTSRESPFTPEGMKKLITEGRKLAEVCPGDDPYWNPNMALGVTQGGLSIQGLNAESLAWEDFSVSGGKGRGMAGFGNGADSVSMPPRRVLVVNDLPGMQGRTIGLLREGFIPFSADLSGFHLKLVAPATMNTVPWDIRDPKRLAKGLNLLGIDTVILRSLVGADGAAPPVEAINSLAATGVDLVMMPHDETKLRPWVDGETPDPRHFGSVDVRAWKEAYENAVDDRAEKDWFFTNSEQSSRAAE